MPEWDFLFLPPLFVPADGQRRFFIANGIAFRAGIDLQMEAKAVLFSHILARPIKKHAPSHVLDLIRQAADIQIMLHQAPGKQIRQHDHIRKGLQRLLGKYPEKHGFIHKANASALNLPLQWSKQAAILRVLPRDKPGVFVIRDRLCRQQFLNIGSAHFQRRYNLKRFVQNQRVTVSPDQLSFRSGDS